MEENVESNKVSHILSEARESCQRSGGANAVSCLLGYSSLSLLGIMLAVCEGSFQAAQFVQGEQKSRPFAWM